MTETSKSNGTKNVAAMSAARRWLLLGAAVLALFSGLCTVFAAVVTAVQAWEEHAQAAWPVVTGTVDTCDVEYASTGTQRRRQYLRCRFNYSTSTGAKTVTLSSTYFPAADAAQYPANQRQVFIDWANAHPRGTPIQLRYDPKEHGRAVLAEDYMPRGGPRTANNLRLLAVFAGLCVVAMAVMQVLKPRDANG